MNINNLIKQINAYRTSSSSCSQKSMVIALLFEKKEVSTIDLKDMGVMYPSQIIASLSKQGAIIGKVKKDAIDKTGRLHQRIVHYTLVGWLE